MCEPFRKKPNFFVSASFAGVMELLGFLLRLILEPVIKLKAFLLLEIKWKKVALPLKKKRIDAASKVKEAAFERTESLETTPFQVRKKDFSKDFSRMNEKRTLELISQANSRYLSKCITSSKGGKRTNLKLFVESGFEAFGSNSEDVFCGDICQFA